MSTVIMSRCWPLQMPPMAKAVLISLADNANDHGVCWPSQPTIAARVCLSERTVRNAIKRLEEAGYLVADRSNGRHTRYTITPTPERGATPEQGAGAERRAGDPGTSCRQPRHQVPPNRKEPSITVKNDSTADAVPDDPPPRGRRGTRLPDGWQPSGAVREWAAAEFPAVSIEAELAAFSDYWRAVPGQRGVKLDWDATFRNRVREIAARRRTGEHRGPHRESAAGRAARLAREGDERDARRAREAVSHTQRPVIEGTWLELSP